MVTASAQQCNTKGSHVYSNLGFCLAVLFLQGRHGPDLILVALAGRVGNVVGRLPRRS
jgi:hypothetical protein